MIEATFLPLFPSTQNNRLGYKTEEQARNDSVEVCRDFSSFNSSYSVTVGQDGLWLHCFPTRMERCWMEQGKEGSPL